MRRWEAVTDAEREKTGGEYSYFSRRLSFLFFLCVYGLNEVIESVEQVGQRNAFFNRKINGYYKSAQKKRELFFSIEKLLRCLIFRNIPITSFYSICISIERTRGTRLK